MTILELEEKLKEEGLLSIYFENGALKKYVPGDKVFYDGRWHNNTNIYGIYKKNGKFYFFITDEERGIPSIEVYFSSEKDACDKLYKYISREKILSDRLLSVLSVSSSRETFNRIQNTVLNGIKIPHSTSYPVIRLENGKYYLAVFVFYYNCEDIQQKAINRPTTWAIADIETGEIIKEYETKEKDFSDAPYDIKYSIIPDKKYDLSQEYYNKAFQHLDVVRNQIIENNEVNFQEYNSYLSMILENIPKEYKRFYKELSI